MATNSATGLTHSQYSNDFLKLDPRIEEMMKDPLLARNYQNFCYQQGILSLGASLGTGAYAKVVAATIDPHSPLLGEIKGVNEVAIKIVDREMAKKSPNSYSLKKNRKGGESQALKLKSHPHLLTTYSLITLRESDNTLAIRSKNLWEANNETILGVVIEKINNVQGELFDIDYSKRMDLVVNCTQQILRGIEAMHSQDILHRDIKPENVLVTENGRVVVIDYGFARDLKECPTGRTTSILGSPSYTAPEVFKGTGYGKEADIFSVGALVYTLAFRSELFREANDEDGRQFNENSLAYQAAFLFGKFSSVEEYQRKKTYNYSAFPADRDPKFWSFLNRLVHGDPSRRATATEALQDPFLN